MSTATYTTWHIETILESLESALKVTRDPELLNEQGHPYCHGYLDAAVSNAVFELKELISRAEK